MLDYDFLYALEGTPYGSHVGSWFNIEAPFWATDLPLLHSTVIRHQSCNNAGVGNLARRSAGLSPIGGMSSWWGAYALLGETYDPYFTYPMGTLLLRSYRGVNDPGHLGVLTPKGVLHSTLDRGVVLEPEFESWDLAVHPRYWLTTSA